MAGKAGFTPRQEEVEEKNEGAGMMRWLLTYADMITLLMLFFIVLYSMSVVSKKKFEELAQSLAVIWKSKAGKTRINLGQNNLLPANQVNPMAIKDAKESPTAEMVNPGQYLSRVYKDALSMFQPEIDARKVVVSLDKRGLMINLGADNYFETGSADIRKGTFGTLNKIAYLLKRIPNEIQIEGHTDSMNIKGKIFPSNWELSSQRAINVLKYFVEADVKETRMNAAAYGMTKPLESNNTPEGRAVNRRIDIIILQSGYND